MIYVAEDKNMCKVIFLSPRSFQFNKRFKLDEQTATVEDSRSKYKAGASEVLWELTRQRDNPPLNQNRL